MIISFYNFCILAFYPSAKSDFHSWLMQSIVQSEKSHCLYPSFPQRLPAFIKMGLHQYPRVHRTDGLRLNNPKLLVKTRYITFNTNTKQKARSFWVVFFFTYQAHLCQYNAIAAAQKGSLSCLSSLSLCHCYCGYIQWIKQQWSLLHIKIMLRFPESYIPLSPFTLLRMKFQFNYFSL